MTPRTPAGSKAVPRPTYSRSSASAAAPRGCTGTTWWSVEPDRKGMRRVSSRREKVRQPGADASPHRVTRQAGKREPGREFHASAQFSGQLPKNKKKTPALKSQGLSPDG